MPGLARAECRRLAGLDDMLRPTDGTRGIGRDDLAERVRHTAIVEGDGAGFDIRSFFLDGRTKCIEVKTTTGPKETDFFISSNEVQFSSSHADSYELCRVFEYSHTNNSGKSYPLFGNISHLFYLRPTHYRVSRLTQEGNEEEPNPFRKPAV